MEVRSGSNSNISAFADISNKIENATDNLKELKSIDVKINKMNIPGKILNKLSLGKYERYKNKENKSYDKLTGIKSSISGSKQQIKGLLKQRRTLQKEFAKSNDSELKKDIENLDRSLELLEDSVGKLEEQLGNVDQSLGKTRAASKIRANVISLNKKFTHHHEISPGHVKYQIAQLAAEIDKTTMTHEIFPSIVPTNQKEPEVPTDELTEQLDNMKNLDQQGVKRVGDTKRQENTTKLREGKPVVADAAEFKSTNVNVGRARADNYNNRGLIKQSLVSSVPPIPLTISSSSSQAEPEAFDFNTYGLKDEGLENPPTNNNGKTPEKVGDAWYLDKADAESADKVGSGQAGGVTFWTVADGAGNKESGRKAAENAVKGFNNGLQASLNEKRPSNLQEAAQFLIDGIDKAQKQIEDNPVGDEEIGKATVAQSMVVDGYLLTVQLGDTSCFVLRPKEEGGYESIPIASLSEGHNAQHSDGGVGKYLHEFDVVTGAEKGSTNADLVSARIGVMKLQEGDLVVSGSDGIGDNLSAGELAELAGNETVTPTNLGEKIHEKVREKVNPWLEASIKEGKWDREIKKESEKPDSKIKGKPDHLGFMIYQHGLENNSISG